jgi:hypothetical protein
MIGLIDPALLLPRLATEQDSLRFDIDQIVKTCRNYSIDLLPFDEYWPFLWRSLGQNLEKDSSPEFKRSLQQLRKLGNNMRHQASPPQDADVWRRGFTALFSTTFLPAGWETRMAQAAARAVATDKLVVLFTRRIEGRNLKIHKSGHVDLHENTRWILYINCRGMGPRNILCVYNPVNITHRWTVRFDWRLPGEAQGSKFPFFPPTNWWKGGIRSFKTVGSKPAWLDKWGNGWARPNIPNGAGYHWDVMVGDTALQENIGLDQINVVQFGCPATEGAPGQLHHVPSKKVGRIKPGAGWQ